MRVLVTRPLPDAEVTAEDLRRLGHEPVLAPMLATQFVDWATILQSQLKHALPDALVATSPNGVRGMARHPAIERFRSLPFFVTGDSSARLAQTLGFEDVRSAHGDVVDVITRISAELPPRSQLLYAAGHDRTGDLAGILATKGYRIEVAEVYSAVAVSTLAAEIATALREGRIDRVLIFSARTAETFIAALAKDDLLPVSRHVPIHAISSQSAMPLRAAGFQSIVVALRPDTAELLASIEKSR
jgi:uroporphyrinogen-III synthase